MCLCATPWTVAHQDPLSVGFFRQEYWSGLPGLPPGDLPGPRLKLSFSRLLHWQMDSLSLVPPGNTHFVRLLALVAQSGPTFCDLMDCSLPGSLVHGIFQASVLELVAISSSRGIFPTQGSNPGLSHCRQMLYCLSHQGTAEG